jgi:hypothetical protein
MTIRDVEKFLAGIWDWGFLDQCFEGTKIRVTDIDGFVERNGKFLVLETKQKGVAIPNGQRIMFENMQKTGLFTSVILWGQKNAVEDMQVYYSTQKTPKKAASNEDFQRLVNWWFNHVNNTRVHTFKDVGS